MPGAVFPYGLTDEFGHRYAPPEGGSPQPLIQFVGEAYWEASRKIFARSRGDGRYHAAADDIMQPNKCAIGLSPVRARPVKPPNSIFIALDPFKGWPKGVPLGRDDRPGTPCR